MKKVFPVILILIICMLFAVSCAANEKDAELPAASDAQTADAPVQMSDERYVAISCMSSYEYFTDHRIGFTKACQELGVDFE